MRNTIFLVLIAALVIIYIVVNKTPATEEQVSNETETTQISDSTDPAEQMSGNSFDYLLPDDWGLTERAEQGIASLASDQTIEFGIVTDPNNENVVYFSSTVFDDELEEQLVSVYKYQTDNYNFERLFRTSYGEGRFPNLDEPNFVVLHVVGYEDGKLIILAQDSDDSPGPCAEPILMGWDENRGTIRNLLTLDIAEPYSGFEEYTPPEEVAGAARERQTQCKAGL